MQHLRIGQITRVDSDRLEIRIDTLEKDVTLNDRRYVIGQLGSYVAVTQGDRTIVAFITQSTCVPSTMLDVSPTVLLEAQLLGEIVDRHFVRGVNEYPVVGAQVRLAIQEDFDAIFGTVDELIGHSAHPRAFTLGKFALNTDYDVEVLGSEFFNKHVAVLGNSGSGKSCTTARILHEVAGLGESQVVLFDLHGEYRHAFSDKDGNVDSRVTYVSSDDLLLPYWMLRYDEFEALFLDESDPRTISTQASFLRTALIEFKRDAAVELGLTQSLTLDTPIYFNLEKLKTYAENLNDARFVLNDNHLAFTQLALRSLDIADQHALMRTQRCSFNRGNPEGETPHPVYFGKLIGLIDKLDTLFHDRRYEFLMRPLDHSQRSRYFRGKLDAEDSAGKASGLMSDLIRLLTGQDENRSNITIIDLSGIPFEIIDVTVAVLSRLMFDLNFWTPSALRHPTLLVFEEAHNYIPRVQGKRHFAATSVERIAKEGRKYGVSAMVVSQRPSELSETVLAQCNNLVVMRLNNPEDQQYVTKVVSDHFAPLIHMLPILRPGEAFVIGDSVIMPMRTLVNMPAHPPQSGNVDFFKHWSADSPQGNIDEVIAHWRRQDRQGGDVAELAPEPPSWPTRNIIAEKPVGVPFSQGFAAAYQPVHARGSE